MCVCVVVASPLSGISPQPTKLVKPMKTLMEEQQSKPLLHRDDDVRMIKTCTIALV